MTSTPTRRAFLSAGAALTATAAAPLALASTPDPDRVVRELVEAYQVAERAKYAASGALFDAQHALSKAPAPAIPEALFRREGDGALHLSYPPLPRGHRQGEPVAYTAACVAKIRGQSFKRMVHRKPEPGERGRDWLPHETIATTSVVWVEAKARADEIVAAWDALQAEHEARRQAFDLPRLEREEAAAKAAWQASWKAVADTPAETIAGAILKARVVAQGDTLEDLAGWVKDGDCRDDAVMRSLVLDLVRLQGGRDPSRLPPPLYRRSTLVAKPTLG